MSDKATYIEYIQADQALREQIGREWSQKVADHMHIEDGFSLVARHAGAPVGLISVCWRELPPPLPETQEGFIDIIEVAPGFRRQGIAGCLVELAAERAKAQGAYQLRAWSSQDKTEAIPMWRALGFGLCPAVVYPRGQEVHGYFVALVL